MALAQEEIVKTLLSARMRVLASVWVIERDAPAAEDIFQNVTAHLFRIQSLRSLPWLGYS